MGATPPHPPSHIFADNSTKIINLMFKPFPYCRIFFAFVVAVVMDIVNPVTLPLNFGQNWVNYSFDIAFVVVVIVVVDVVLVLVKSVNSEPSSAQACLAQVSRR